MSTLLKYTLIVGTSLIVMAISIGASYWAGYSTGNADGWVSGNITGSANAYQIAYSDGHDMGFIEGKKDAFAYWQAKGIEAAKRYIIEHTKGRIEWPNL